MAAHKDLEPLGVSNMEFAQEVGIHFSMASKLRHGHRAPSLETLLKIKKRYGLPADDILDAAAGGPEAFGAYLRKQVFRDEEVLGIAV